MRKTKRIADADVSEKTSALRGVRPAVDDPVSRLGDLAAVCHAAPPTPALRAALAKEAETVLPVAGEFVVAEPYEAIPGEAAKRARELVTKYTLLACGSGVIPSATLYLATGTAVMAKMLRDLSAVYARPRVSWPRVGMLSLIGGLVATGGVNLVADVVGYMLPVAGGLLRSARPLSIGIATYAVGTAAIQHFESPRGETEPLTLTALATAAGGMRNEAKAAVMAMRPA